MKSRNEQQFPGSSVSGVSKRLREYLLKRHGSVNEFCRVSGIKYPAQMTPYLKGKCLPGKKMLDRLEKDGADIQWLLTGHTAGYSLAPLSNVLALSRYRMDIDNLLRQVRMNVDLSVAQNKPSIEAYAVIDHAERIVDLSGSLEKFLAYEPNSLSEVSLSFLIHPDDYLSVKHALEIQRLDDDIVTFHSRFKMGNGDYTRVEWCLYIKNKPMSDLSEYSMILRKSGS